MLDEEGELLDLAIYGASRYVGMDLVNEITLIYLSSEQTNKDLIKPFEEAEREHIVESGRKKLHRHGKLILMDNILYYVGPGIWEDNYVIRNGDVEIHIDKYYEINRVILWTMDKYLGSGGY